MGGRGSSSNNQTTQRVTYDELKAQGYDIKNPDYRIYDLGTEYSFNQDTIQKIQSKKIGYSDTVKVKREIAISEWSLGGESGKAIQKGKTVRTMTIDVDIPLVKLNNMNLSLKKDLLNGKTVKSKNKEPVLNQLNMGFKTKKGIVYTYK